MTATITYDMPESVYHARPEFSRSDAHCIHMEGLYVYEHRKRFPKEPTDAMLIGTILHNLALTSGEPDYAIWDSDKPRRGKEWDAFRKDAADAGREIVRDKEYNIAASMEKDLRAHPVVGKLLRAKAERELTIIWDDEELGHSCRCRVDLLPLTGPDFYDIKSCDSLPASPEKLWESVRDYGYDTQGAFYPRGIAAAGFGDRRIKFIFVTRSLPRRIMLVGLKDEWYERGNEIIRSSAEALAFAHLTGEYPDTFPGEYELDMPTFLRKEPTE